MQHDPVPLQPVGAGNLRPRLADGIEAVDEDVLDLRKGDDPAILVTHGRHVEDLGHSDEAFVRRIVAGDAVEQVRLAGRCDRPDLEVREPPHLESAGDHRVQPTELDIFGERLGVGLGGHPVGALAAFAGPSERELVDVSAGRDHGDASDRAGQRGVGQQLA